MTDEHVLNNPRADRVRKIAALATRAGRRKQGRFLVEGPQPVREALQQWLENFEDPANVQQPDPKLPALDALFFHPDALQRHLDVQALLDRIRGVLFDPERELPRGAGLFLREATSEVLAAMGDAETSQGLIALARVPEAAQLAPADLLQSIPAAGSSSNEQKSSGASAATLIAGVLSVQDPGNMGTIIRAADAAGADAVVLSAGSADPYSPKVVRSAAGSHFHLPILTGVQPQELAEASRAAGLQVLAADGTGEVPLPQLQGLGQPTLWLLGNEAQGLSEDQKELADSRVSIPLYGRAESLNVSTAAAICLYSTAMAQNSRS